VALLALINKYLLTLYYVVLNCIIITGWSLVIVIGAAFPFFMMYIQMEGPY
jgi:hypothetical protein